MLKYAKIINKTTNQVMIGLGNNVNYYKSIGFKELDVEQDNKGNWYLKNFLPKQDINLLKENKLKELKQDVENYFYNKYPIYKQNNIAIFGTRKDKQQFQDFHDVIVKQYNVMIDKINNCKDIEEINNIIINFNKNV